MARNSGENGADSKKDVKPKEESPEEGLPIAATPDLPRKAAEKRLQEQLRQRGLSEMAAEAIARTVVDPADARLKLQAPARKRVPGAVIEYITTPVWTPMVAPYALNYRHAAIQVLPISDDTMPYPALDPAEGAPDGRSELILNVHSGEQLVAALKRATEYLLENNPLNDSIALQGVLEPVTLAAMTIKHQDGSKDVSVLTSVDGSTRTATGHHLLGVEDGAAVYRFPFDDRRFRQLVAGVSALADKPHDELTEAEKAKVRALTMPANIITGVTIADGGDFARVVMSLVGQIHVDPPRTWGAAGELDAQADAALNELVDSYKLSAPRAKYFSGHMSRDEAKAAGMPNHLDERALWILIVLTNHQYVAAKGVRRVVPKARIEWDTVADIAVELSARAFRGQLNRGEATTARAALQRIFRRVEFKNARFAMTRRSPEELRDAALAELAKKSGPGPDLMELAHLAAYYLTRWRQLRRPDRQDDDIREPDVVLKGLMDTTWGVQVLYQALVDGRRGIPTKQTSKTGTTIIGADGKAKDVDDRWLRKTVAPDRKPEPIPVPTPTPEVWLQVAKAQLAQLVTTNVEPALARVELVKASGGGSLIEKDGWVAHEAEDYADILQKAAQRLYHWGQVWRNNQGEEAAPDGEE